MAEFNAEAGEAVSRRFCMDHHEGREQGAAKLAADEETRFIEAMQKGIADDLPVPVDWRTMGANMAGRAE